ncbi:MAG TPA: sigma-70 family RNA polymerase sigma factor [Gemmataceae bacterium]|jgi:RNA polymerase sigma-70 factor (ECF subfamily)|nr:sigma-70 family RNA polymerase sigma factor [Gemmataceae bacterium]
MREQPDSRTRASLLARLQQSGTASDDAWREFVDQYGRQIYKWCRHWQLQDADAEEVTQQVMLRLLSKMKDFAYDPGRSFRAWLKTVTHHAWHDLVVSRQHQRTSGGGSEVWEQLLTVPAGEDLVQRLEQEFDRELLEEAMQRVRLRLAPHNWEAFRLTALEGVPARTAAVRLSMKVANVYAARSNVQRLVREELARLEGNPE